MEASLYATKERRKSPRRLRKVDILNTLEAVLDLVVKLCSNILVILVDKLCVVTRHLNLCFAREHQKFTLQDCGIGP